MDKFEEMSLLLQGGKRRDLTARVQQELNDGTTAKEILEKSLIPGMEIVGIRFKNDEIFVPQVLVAARAMNEVLAILRPILTNSGVEPLGKVVICTVKGDLHDIGKNIVRIMLEGTGFSVIDLGVDIDSNTVVEAVKEHHPDIVCLSALLTTTMEYDRVIINDLIKEGLRDSVKVMVGGAPVTQKFADEIGADSYTPDAASCAAAAKALLGK